MFQNQQIIINAQFAKIENCKNYIKILMKKTTFCAGYLKI